MHQVKRSALTIRSRLCGISKFHSELCFHVGSKPAKHVSDVSLIGFSSVPSEGISSELPALLKSGFAKQSSHDITKNLLGANGIPALSRGHHAGEYMLGSKSSFLLTEKNRANIMSHSFTRSLASTASKEPGHKSSQTKKDITTVEDPFDAPTYNIPDKPVTFAEGASYSVIILAGLGVAAAAAYAVFQELIFQPKEYKIFNMALKRIQDDSQVRMRIGTPVTGYGQESRNRAARQRIPNRAWTDEDGVERVEVNFYIRGPRGAGKVFTEMFKDKVDKQWKYTYLIVEIQSPSPAQLMLESYVPA